jgi:DNA-binding transcriptional ArsR family regulator
MNALSELLSSRVKAEVFRLLFGLTACELHVRELERQSGLSVSTVRQELRRLTGLGLLEVRKDGNRTYYSANHQHPLYPDIRSLVLKTSGLADVLRQALTHPGIQVAFVFGSLASGAEQAHSDVDLMIIGTATLRKVGPLLSGIATQLGREVNPHIMTPGEFAQRRDSRDHFLTSVLDSPRLFVLGDEHDLESKTENP